MEKKAFRIGIFSGIMAGFLFSLISCTFEITEKKRITDPDVKSALKGFIVSLKNSSQDTLYVNFYRQDVTNIINENEEIDEPIVNIGIVFPYTKSNSTNNTTFTFEDNYVITGRKYRYCARLYSETEGYTYTNWTPIYRADTGIETETVRFYYGVPSTTKFIYDEPAKTITVSGNISNPNVDTNEVYERLFSPALVFESEKGQKIFQVESIADNSIIYLSNLLPADFQGIDIKFLGIVGQKTETYTIPKSDVTKTQRVVWTLLSPVPFYDKNNELVPDQIIRLNPEYGESGFDYSY